MRVRDLGYVRASLPWAALQSGAGPDVRVGAAEPILLEDWRVAPGGGGRAAWWTAGRCGSGDTGAPWPEQACSMSLGEPHVSLQGGVPGV